MKKIKSTPPLQGGKLKKIRWRCILSFVLFVGTLMPVCGQSSVKRVTLNLQNAEMEEFIRQIKTQTGFTFFYNDKLLPKLEPVTVRKNNAPLEEVLRQVLEPKGFTFTIEGTTIVIRESREEKKQEIQGRVEDETGNPLPGVTIRLSGTSIGTASDPEGKFRLVIPGSKPVVLVASFVGMKDSEVRVIPGKEVHIRMEASEHELEEVVVNGLFTQNRNSYTGAVTSVKGEDLLTVSKTNVFKALSLLVPGMRIVENNAAGSNPNTIPEIILRGMNSISSDEMETGLNRPLIVLDGVEISLEQLYDIDMFEIERVDVLKDASATAVYGEKAANGVIVVERKRVTESKLRVRYNFVPNISFPDVSSFNLCSPMEKLELERRFGKYPSSGINDEEYNEKLKRITSGVNTDWKSIPLRNSWSHSHSLNITGRGSGMDYGISARYADTRGVMKGDYRRNLGVNFYFSYNLGRKLTVSYRSDFSKTNSKDSPYGDFSEWSILNPYDSPKDKDGNWIKLLSYNLRNPYYDATLDNFSKSEDKTFTNTLSLRWAILKGLYFTGNASYTLSDEKSDKYVSPDDSEFALETDASKKGRYDVSGSKSNNWQVQGTLNYSLSLDENGTLLSVHAGGSANQNQGNSYSFSGIGFSKNRLNDLNFAQSYPVDGRPSGGESYGATVAVYANANFILLNRYFVDASWRTSGNSVLGKDRRWQPYWSFGIGWNLHNENFIAGLGWISTFRLKGSVGYVGSGNFGGVPAETIYSYSSAYDGYVGASPSAMGNPMLKSQRTLKWNGGMNLSFLEGRLDVNLDVYKEVSKDLLMAVSLSSSTGYSSVKYNLGESSNHGYELAVVGQVIRTRDWGWSISANTSHTVNKILKISNSLKKQNEENLNDYGSAPKILLEEGKSATALYAVRSAGIDPVSGREIFIDKEGNYTFNYDPQDKVVVGNTLPKLQGALSTAIRWKNLSVFAGFSYTLGADIYNTTRATKIESINVEQNVDRRAYTERWNNVNDVVLYLKPEASSAGRHTERFVERRNELYFSTLNISYDMNGGWLKKIGLKRLALGIGFSDIARLSTVKFERGTSYPYMRGYNFTISPTF